MGKNITSAWLEKHSACPSGSRWFASRFPDGAEISDVLVKIVIDHSADDSWVGWLMSRAKYKKLDWISKLPESIGGWLDLRGCTIPEGLKLPESIGGSLDLRGCTIPEGLKLPESIGGSLDLGGCTIPEGLKLPESIGVSLYLGGCTIPEGLKLPESIGGSLDLGGCTGIKKDSIPKSLKNNVIW